MNENFCIFKDGISVSVGKRKKETVLADDHRHHYYELYYMTTGRAKFFIDNEIININQGEVMIVREGIIHKTVYEENLFTERLLICFTEDFTGKRLKPIIEELGERKLIKLTPHDQIEIEKMMTRLKDENSNQYSYALENAYHILSEMLILLFRQKKNIDEKKLTSNEVIIQSAAKYIAENFNVELTLSQLAEKFAMSQSYFSKTFKALTGFGVIEYITAIRISNAELLLKTTNKSITSVATECGFNDSNYFASIFKKKNGITPLKYAMMSKNK